MARLFLMIFMALVAALPLSILPFAANAGSSEAGTPVLPASQVAAFSDRVQRDLAARGAHVAIVARTGRHPSQLPDGVRYTHVAFWVYSRIENADGSTGRGYRAYNLYQRADNDARSRLVQDSPADFFAGAHRLDAGVIIPDPRLQEKLLSVIAGQTYRTMHNPRYSVLANPDNNQFQNCTEHTLNVLVASLYGTRSMGQVKANIAAHFVPQPIRIGGVKGLLAPAALPRSDHARPWRADPHGHIRLDRAVHEGP